MARILGRSLLVRVTALVAIASLASPGLPVAAAREVVGREAGTAPVHVPEPSQVKVNALSNGWRSTVNQNLINIRIGDVH